MSVSIRSLPARAVKRSPTHQENAGANKSIQNPNTKTVNQSPSAPLQPTNVFERLYTPPSNKRKNAFTPEGTTSSEKRRKITTSTKKQSKLPAIGVLEDATIVEQQKIRISELEKEVSLLQEALEKTLDENERLYAHPKELENHQKLESDNMVYSLLYKLSEMDEPQIPKRAESAIPSYVKPGLGRFNVNK